MKNTKPVERPTLSALAEQNILDEGGYKDYKYSDHEHLSRWIEKAAIRVAWARGDYGTLMDHKTGTDIRPATFAEALRSYEAASDGVIGIDGCDGDVYVSA